MDDFIHRGHALDPSKIIDLANKMIDNPISLCGNFQSPQEGMHVITPSMISFTESYDLLGCCL